MRRTPRACIGSAFLTNHAYVLMVLVKTPKRSLKEVAAMAAMTQRGAQRILKELCDDGYIQRAKEGRKNVYTFDLKRPLMHADGVTESSLSLEEFMTLM